MNQPPPPIPSPIIHNNNTMDTEFLVQMRQSNKCGSVKNDEIFNLHLGSGAGIISLIGVGFELYCSSDISSNAKKKLCRMSDDNKVDCRLSREVRLIN